MASPETALRLLRIGDNWNYRVVGTLTPPGAGPLEVSGEIGVSIVADRLTSRDDRMTILFAQKLTVLQPDGSRQDMPAPPWMFSFVQDQKTRDLAIAADNMTHDGAPRIAKEPQVFYPGTWSEKTAYDNVLEFENGESVHNTLSVTGVDPVETGQGSFVAWKSTITSESAATGLIQGLDWWTPELGAPAKFATVSKMPDGSEMRFTATLSKASL